MLPASAIVDLKCDLFVIEVNLVYIPHFKGYNENDELVFRLTCPPLRKNNVKILPQTCMSKLSSE